MSDHVLIYLIVILNTLCQLMLIWRQKGIGNTRWLFVGVAVAVPLLVIVVMNQLVARGIINSHVAQQSRAEHLITNAMSILLLAGPWLVTIAAVIRNKRSKHP
jgi:hypothetical protein